MGEGEPIELDAVDAAVIRALQTDGRVPYSKLGPMVGLSQAAVRLRVQRLIDRGVMQVVAVTDPMQLGFYRQAMIGIRATGDTTKVELGVGLSAQVRCSRRCAAERRGAIAARRSCTGAAMELPQMS